MMRYSEMEAKKESVRSRYDPLDSITGLTDLDEREEAEERRSIDQERAMSKDPLKERAEPPKIRPREPDP